VAIAQIIGILAMPLVTRIYSPESFGVYALFASIAGAVGVIACLRFELAIMLPKNDEDGANVLALSLLSLILIGVLSIPFIYIIRDPLLELFRIKEIGPYLWMMSLAILVAGLSSAFSYWNSRCRRFGNNSLALFIGSGVSAAVQLGSGYTGHVSEGSLIWAYILGMLSSAIVSGLTIWMKDGAFLRNSIRVSAIRENATRYRALPKYDIWNALLTTVSWNMPLYILAIYFQSDVIGYYSLSLSFLLLPVNLLSGSISRVFFRNASLARFDASLPDLIASTVSNLALLSFFPFLVLSIMGRDLFIVLFGPQWNAGGIYIEMLAPMVMVQFIASPMGVLFNILEMQKVSLIYAIIILPIRMLSIILGGVLGNPEIAIALFSIVQIMNYLFCLIWLFRATGTGFSRFRDTLMRLIPLSMCVSLIAILKYYFSMRLEPLLLVILALTVVDIYIIGGFSALLSIYRNMRTRRWNSDDQH